MTKMFFSFLLCWTVFVRINIHGELDDTTTKSSGNICPEHIYLTKFVTYSNSTINSFISQIQLMYSGGHRKRRRTETLPQVVMYSDYFELQVVADDVKKWNIISKSCVEAGHKEVLHLLFEGENGAQYSCSSSEGRLELSVLPTTPQIVSVGTVEVEVPRCDPRTDLRVHTVTFYNANSCVSFTCSRGEAYFHIFWINGTTIYARMNLIDQTTYRIDVSCMERSRFKISHEFSSLIWLQVQFRDSPFDCNGQLSATSRFTLSVSENITSTTVTNENTQIVAETASTPSINLLGSLGDTSSIVNNEATASSSWNDMRKSETNRTMSLFTPTQLRNYTLALGGSDALLSAGRHEFRDYTNTLATNEPTFDMTTEPNVLNERRSSYSMGQVSVTWKVTINKATNKTTAFDSNNTPTITTRETKSFVTASESFKKVSTKIITLTNKSPRFTKSFSVNSAAIIGLTRETVTSVRQTTTNTEQSTKGTRCGNRSASHEEKTLNAESTNFFGATANVASISAVTGFLACGAAVGLYRLARRKCFKIPTLLPLCARKHDSERTEEHQ